MFNGTFLLYEEMTPLSDFLSSSTTTFRQKKYENNSSSDTGPEAPSTI